ncbi:MAG: PLP-dependent aminotransferase family protein [Flavobacteriaceae bacterium]|nr:PLP-dependent aminotransferase family protein [Flavobacteriaceae bacterium]
MSHSPVFKFFEKSITFDKTQPQPVYIQVSQQIINAIQRGYLHKGSLLPGTRKVSELLQIHRNTAVAIYDELASQGWVEIIPNKGTYVLENNNKSLKIKSTSETRNTPYSHAIETGFPFQESFHLSSTSESSDAKLIINEGKPDLRLHPVHQFSRWYSSSMKRKTLIKKWSNPLGVSHALFQNQLCNYLNITRGFHINPTNLVNTRSTEMSLYIVSQLLIKPKDVVIVGHLSNYAANMIFQQVGANIKTIPVDHEGLNVDYIKENFTKQSIRCVYVNSQRDYPTTAMLSIERRLKLLALAREYNFAIIEDDYDYDFQFDGYAMPPLATADEKGMVIYLGKLGQSLFPSFQTGFVVAPQNLISEAKNYLQLLDKQGDLIQEQMLFELINEGEIYRLMKKSVTIYRERRDYLCKKLNQHFKKIASWNVPSGGLALWLTFTPKISLVQLAKAAENNNLFLPKTLLYQDANTCSIRLGFGSLDFNEIDFLVQQLKIAYHKVS